MGWSFALYLGWSLSEKILARWRGTEEPPLFSVVFLVSVFMASIAYAVEAGAGALSWWVWTIPVTSRHLLEVPAAGIWAWFSVAVDFFLPFLVLVNRRAFPGWARIAVLLIFPIHMATHLLDVVGGHWGFNPVMAPSAVAHWIMLFGVLALATNMRLPTVETPYSRKPPALGFVGSLPIVVIVMLLTVIWLGYGPVGGRWDLFAASGPLLVFALISFGIPMWLVFFVAAALSPLAGWRGFAALVSAVAIWVVAALIGRPGRRTVAWLTAIGILVASGMVVFQSVSMRRLEQSYQLARAAAEVQRPIQLGEEIVDRAPGMADSEAVFRMRAGIALRRSGYLAPAAEEFARVVEIEPNLVWSRNELGVTLSQLGSCTEAVGHLEKAVRQIPSSHQLNHNLGIAYLCANRPQYARDAFERAIELNSEDLRPVIGLAQVELMIGREAIAEQIILEALEKHPDSATLESELSALLHSTGDLVEAERHCRRSLELDPSHIETRCRLALILAKDPSTIDEARQVAQRAVALDETGLTLDTLGYVLIKSGRREEARAALLRAFSRCSSPQICQRISQRLRALEGRPVGPGL